jgi:hypothetical protein
MQSKQKFINFIIIILFLYFNRSAGILHLNPHQMFCFKYDAAYFVNYKPILNKFASCIDKFVVMPHNQIDSKYKILKASHNQERKSL